MFSPTFYKDKLLYFRVVARWSLKKVYGPYVGTPYQTYLVLNMNLKGRPVKRVLKSPKIFPDSIFIVLPQLFILRKLGYVFYVPVQFRWGEFTIQWKCKNGIVNGVLSNGKARLSLFLRDPDYFLLLSVLRRALKIIFAANFDDSWEVRI